MTLVSISLMIFVACLNNQFTNECSFLNFSIHAGRVPIGSCPCYPVRARMIANHLIKQRQYFIVYMLSHCKKSQSMCLCLN